MKYAFIAAELTAYPLSVVCWVLSVTQSGFHAWRGRPPSRRELERDQLRAQIRTVFDDQRGRSEAAYTGRVNRIQSLMRAMGLCARAGKKFKVTTDSGHALPVFVDL